MTFGKASLQSYETNLIFKNKCHHSTFKTYHIYSIANDIEMLFYLINSFSVITAIWNHFKTKVFFFLLNSIKLYILNLISNRLTQYLERRLLPKWFFFVCVSCPIKMKWGLFVEDFPNIIGVKFSSDWHHNFREDIFCILTNQKQ